MTWDEIQKLAGPQGIIGLAGGNPGWLCLHVVLGGLAAAALSAHNTVNFALLELRYSPA